MDSFAQAAAYLQPSLEFVAKLSSLIPMWMLMVMADKHFLGLPLLEGSVWYSPRIPPRFAISSGRGGEHASGSKSGRHSASLGPSPLGRDFPGSTIPYPRPLQAQPQGASTTTALTLYQTLEGHVPFVSSSGWLEHGYVGSAVLLVLMISFLAIITTGCGYLFGKSKISQAHNTSNTETPLLAHEQPSGEMEFPRCWESILEDILSNHSDETLEDSLDQPRTPIRADEDESSSPPNMIADTAKENLEEGIPETHNEVNGQEEKTETNGADATTAGGKPENYAEAGNENGSKAGKAAGKESSKEGSKVDTKEDGPGEPGNIENLEISAMGEGIKKKKRRVRQNAKKRAAKIAAAEEAGKEVGDASNALLEGPTQREDKDGKPEKLEPKEVKPEASDALASAKSQKQVEMAGKDVGDSSNAFLEGLKQRMARDGKSKKVKVEVVEPEATDALAAAKAQKETEATAQDTPITGKGGGYSFKGADLHDATFVAADTANKTSLPPRPPTPQPTKKPVPVGLPSKPQFTGLPTPKSSGTPQPSPAATANPSPGSDLLASLITRPKGSVPPLMPYHQSFGAAQSSSNGPSGQFSTPFQNNPGLNIPKTTPAPNYIQFKPGAANTSPDGMKPLFGNLPAQGGPKAGTDSRPKNACFGNGYLSAPMLGNLPSAPSSNDAFKLPAFGPSADSGKPSAGSTKMAPTNQSIFQNVPTSSGQFTGFGSPSACPAKTTPPAKSIFQNASISSGQFTGFGSSSAGSAKTIPASQNMSSACPAKTTQPAQSIFQNASISSGQFTGFGSSNAGPAKTTPPKQSNSRNGSISSGQFTGFSQSSPGPTMTTPPNQSILQNASISSGQFKGFGSSSAGPPKTTPPNQSIFKNISVSSGQFTGFGSPSAATTNPPIAHQSSMFQKLAQPPTPLSLGINQQRGMMPLQNAVMGAMIPTAGDKKEGTKPAASPGALLFEPRPMPIGRLGLSKPERPWPSARQGDGASYWRTGESVAWPHARQMNGKPFWR